MYGSWRRYRRREYRRAIFCAFSALSNAPRWSVISSGTALGNLEFSFLALTQALYMLTLRHVWVEFYPVRTPPTPVGDADRDKL